MSFQHLGGTNNSMNEGLPGGMRRSRTIRIGLVVALVASAVLVAVARPTATTAAPGDWSTIPPMSVPRTGHTTTVLGGFACNQATRPAECGMILVTGGRIVTAGGSTVTNLAELYDPAERTWKTLPPMSVARSGHTASAVFGAPGIPPNVAGILPRDQSAPTSLVIVAGGETDTGIPTPTVEAYDIVRGAWRTMAPMATGRVGHSATMLPSNGKTRMFVLGGNGPDGPLRSAESFDPTPVPVGSWTSIGDMAVARTGHTATGIAGPSCNTRGNWGSCNLLVVGGSSEESPSGESASVQTEVLVRTPYEEELPVEDAEYALPTWTDGPNLQTGRSEGHTASVLGGDLCPTSNPGLKEPWCGDVVIAGGRSANGAIVASAEVFRPSSPGSGFQPAGLTAPRTGHQAVSLDDGRVLLVGGIGAQGSPLAALDTTALYDPTRAPDDHWSAGQLLGTARAGGHTATALTTAKSKPMRRVLVVGGHSGPADAPLAAGEVLHAQTAATTWVRGPAMGVARSDHTATLLPGNKILVAGGSIDPRAELYTHEPAAGARKWAFTGQQLLPRSGHTATVLSNNKVLVTGGMPAVDRRLAMGSTELYDVATGQWAAAAPLNHPRVNHTATRLADGKVLVIGGTVPPEAGPSPALAPAEMYDSAANSWTPVAAHPDFRRRDGHTTTLLNDGRLLVAGGRLGEGTSPELKESWLYDHTAAAGSRWTQAGDMTAARADHTATLLDGPECQGGAPMAHCGKVLIAGGVAARAEVFDPDSKKWSEIPNSSVPATASTLLPSGLVLLAGAQSTASLFDPAKLGSGSSGTGLVSSGGDHLDPSRRQHTVTLLPDGTVVLAGGTPVGDGARPTVNTELYDGISTPLDPPGSLTASPLVDDSFGVRLSWTAPNPVRSGGSPVTGYRAAYVEYAPNGTMTKLGPSIFLHGGEQLTTDLRSLPEEDRWTLEVTPFNEAGLGRPAAVHFLRTSSISLPLAPVGVRATAGDRSATIEWNPPPDNGTAVVGYRITTKRLSGSASIPPPLDVAATPTAATVAGLNVGDRYSFTVQALSSPTAAGPASAPSNPILIGLPLGKPRVVDVTARNRSAVVRWLPPPDPGGGPVTSYEITSEPGGATTTVGGGAGVAVVAGLANGVDHRFKVRAANVYGPALVTSDLSEAVARPSLGLPAALPVPAPTGMATPSVTALYPRGGPVTGGGEVVITGEGFLGATEVRFGDAPPASFQVVSPHQIVVVAPRFSAPGRVHVTVAGPGGVSAFTPESPESAYYYGSGGWESRGFVLGAPRSVISATGLKNGKILVTGQEGATATAHLFDPATGRSEATAAPAKPPALATLLPDGKVLAVASVAPICRAKVETPDVDAVPAEYPDSVSSEYPTGASAHCTDPVLPQLYDPASGTWTNLTGAQADAARKKTAANGAAADIAGGKVLLSGGCCNPDDTGYSDGALNGSEIYDPSTNAWTVTANPPLHARNQHTLTTLSGASCGVRCGFVLATGGFRRPYVLGPSYGDPEQLLPPPEEYDPVQNVWRSVAPMNRNRYGHTATLLSSGKVLVTGGSTLRNLESAVVSATATAELFDPVANSWTLTPPMPRVRYKHTATMLPSGKVLVAGGFSPRAPGPDERGTQMEPVTVVDLYDPETNTWSPAGAEHFAGSQTAIPLASTGECGVSCGKVMLIGGSGDVELYSPPPVISTVSPTSAPVGTTPEVTITGRGLANEAEVLVGGMPADIEVPGTDTELKVEPISAPRQSSAPVVVTTTGGEATSADPFVFLGSPGAVKNLTATVQGTNAVRLGFGAAGSVGDADPPAQFYVLKQSRLPITAANFDDARSLCEESGGVCSYEIAHAGDVLNVDVGALRPDTAYHWAVRARVGEAMGPVATVSTTTASLVLSPGRVTDLVSTAVSASELRLTFSAPGSPGADSPPASSYVIKQSRSPIVDLASFDAGRPLCGGLCGFSPQKVGDVLSLSVTGLAPSTTYHYAIRVQHADGTLGELSNLASATTSAPCAPVAGAGSNQVSYSPGYHLVSVPSGTRLSTPVLYGWFNQGSGRYSFHDPATAESGRGYWAWFACPQLVKLATGGASSASSPLSAYRASMVGNPSTIAPATLSGHDFAATWDPSANGGVGAYSLSGFRENLVLGVGQAAWAFSYKDTTLSVGSR